MMGYHFSWFALSFFSLGAFIVRISASLLTFTLKQETVHETHLFYYVMISQSLCISQRLMCNNQNNNKNYFPFSCTEDDWKLDSQTAKSVQCHWAQNLFCKMFATSYTEQEKKIPVPFKSNSQSLQSRILLTAFINAFLQFLKFFFSVAVSASIQRNEPWYGRVLENE